MTSYKRTRHLFMNKTLLSRHFTWTQCFTASSHSDDSPAPTLLMTFTCCHIPSSSPQHIYPSSSSLQCQIVPCLIGQSGDLFVFKPSNWTLYVPDLSVCPHIDSNLSVSDLSACFLSVCLGGLLTYSAASNASRKNANALCSQQGVLPLTSWLTVLI